MVKSFAKEEMDKQKVAQPVAVGLDIGTTKIAVFVGTKDQHGKIEVKTMGKCESLGVERGTVMNVQEATDSIKRALQLTNDNLSRGSINIKKVFVGIAGQHIKSLQHQAMTTRSDKNALITQEEINKFIGEQYNMGTNPGEEIISVIPQDYFIDNERNIQNPIGRQGFQLGANFHIITGHVQKVQQIRDCIQLAGLEIEHIILEPIASAESVLTADEKEGGVVLVDIGGGTTDVAIFQDNLIRHTAVIPFGGNIITEDIKKGCGILKRHAEKLKVGFGKVLVDPITTNDVVVIPGLSGHQHKTISIVNLSQIIEARMREIIELVDHEIKSSGYRGKLLAGIVVTGGGSKLDHITQLFEYMTGLDTRIGRPTEHLSSTNNIEELESPIYATGIGLMLQGFKVIEKKPLMAEPKDTAIEEDREKGKFFEKILNRFSPLFDIENKNKQDDGI